MEPIEIDKGTLAQGGAIPFFIGAMIATLIALSVVWPVMDTAINGGASAVGTFTFTGNSTTGQFVNITKDNGAVMCYYFNSTGIGKPEGCLVVDVRSGGNTSVISATNLTTAINGDTDLDGILTATNPSNNVTVVTADKHGGLFNSYLTSDTVTNGAWGSTKLTGGISDASTMSSAAGTIVDQLPLFLVLILLMVFVKAIV